MLPNTDKTHFSHCTFEYLLLISHSKNSFSKILKPFKQEKKNLNLYKEEFCSPTAKIVSFSSFSNKRKQSGCMLMKQLVTAVQL